MLYTDKWFVSSSKCAKDCDPSTTGGGEETICLTVPSTSTELFDTVELCCDEVTWVSAEDCKVLSEGGTVTTSTVTTTINAGTNEYYYSGIYPDTNKCVKDCPVGSDPLCGGVTTGETYATVDLCCSERVTWVPTEECKVLTEGGTPATAATVTTTLPTGTGEWYYKSGSQCVKDCPVGSDPLCGGVTLEETRTIELCCSVKVSWVPAEDCKILSEGGTVATSTQAATTTTVATGTGEWYYKSGSQCVKDCPVGSDPLCGGVTLEETRTIELCCSVKVSWVPAEDCKILSEGGTVATSTQAATTTTVATGTSEWYYYSGSVCVKDCPVGSAEFCAGVTSGDTYTLDTCCSTKVYWEPEECKILSEGGTITTSTVAATTTTVNTGTGEWYYKSGSVCVKDCPVESAEFCGGVTSGDTYTLDTCCSTKVYWMSGEDCKILSEGGTVTTSTAAATTTTVNTGTGEWYYSGGSKCVKDCPVDSGEDVCGGVTTVDTYTLEVCCSSKVYWMSGEDCKVLSEGGTITTSTAATTTTTIPTGTNGWYYGGGSKCIKDCPVGSDSLCGGVELYQQVFSTLQVCCSTKVTWVNATMCTTASEGGTVSAVSSSLRAGGITVQAHVIQESSSACHVVNTTTSFVLGLFLVFSIL